MSHIRWMISRDGPEVLQIEEKSFEFPWTVEDFIQCLCQRNCIGAAAEYQNQVVGFMIYELFKTKIHLLNFAVHPEWRRCGIGSQMIKGLIYELSPLAVNRIFLEVRERNLSAQLFFQKNGFKAVNILRNYYKDTPEDAYVMQYRYKPELSNKIEKPENLLARIIGRLLAG